jgi:hypothetical protein
VLLGKVETAWQPAEDVLLQSAAVVPLPPNIVPAAGVGDMDGDGQGEIVASDPSGWAGTDGNVYLYRGNGLLAAAERRVLASVAAFPSAGTGGKIAVTGDMNGDGLADFAIDNGGAPKLVFGSAGGNGSCCLTLGGYAPAASGFLAAVGNVDADAQGLGDLLVGAADGSAYLIAGQAGLAAGAPAPAIAARLTDVAGAASLAPLASADANADGSADLVLVPGSAGSTVLATSQLIFGRMPHVPTDALPRGRAGTATGAVAGAASGAAPGTGGHDGPSTRAAAPAPAAAAQPAPQRLQVVTRYVDDDWAGTPNGADPDGSGPATQFGTNAFATIQAAVNAAASGDTIDIAPGVYAGFEVSGGAKNDLTLAGDNADAVFVNGTVLAGVSVGAYIHDVAGVTLSGFTFRDAARRLHLAAGRARRSGAAHRARAHFGAGLRHRVVHRSSERRGGVGQHHRGPRRRRPAGAGGSDDARSGAQPDLDDRAAGGSAGRQNAGRRR